MKLIPSFVLIAGLCSVISGCGGSSSAPTTATGKFIDGPVGGLTYVSGALSGTTAPDGSFTYEIGKSVKFSVNGIVIGEAPAEAVMTPIHLAAVHDPNANASSDEVVNIVRFLMAASTIDAHGAMTIDNTKVVPTSSHTLAFSNTTSAFRNMINDVAPGMAAVSVSQAKTHLTSSINSQCAGTYTGTYQGFQTVAINSTFPQMTSAMPGAGGRNQGGALITEPTILGSWTITIKSDGTASGSTSRGEAINGSLSNGITFHATVGENMVWDGKLNLAGGSLSGFISYMSTGRNQGGGSIQSSFTGSR
ncbi:hypothetical protein [Geobacter sp. SVR]|uniref:hypothetical protein n=1 Tax=Geobacter sp. SVR TaxID=2495594 RepID=UPI00143EFA81|nr:hypothetical protein [Geobacter sp. SVR]BCS55340.1 hypothetical protein GSVR_36480 [Geobacter sp. SVR]GCF87265.1 hypothetical protein GSbR_38650 [Geobacter sp. SVR]